MRVPDYLVFDAGVRKINADIKDFDNKYWRDNIIDDKRILEHNDIGKISYSVPVVLNE
jgi:hypothetical protein